MAKNDKLSSIILKRKAMISLEPRLLFQVTIMKNLKIAIIPLLLALWGLFLVNFLDPFSSRSVDPEYVYLINGLNCAQLHFNWIGHFDHPGTPFQIYCGIIIKITHIFAGNGDIVQDVLADPNFYLKAISISIFLLQIFLLLAIGLVAQKREIPIGQTLLLQSGFLFNDVVIWLFSRVNPDVFFIIVTTLFILIYLKFGYKEHSTRKFAIWSGIIMGLGFASKFNYLPILILPFIFIHNNKNRLIYSGTVVAAFFVFISPIINKFHYYKDFIIKIMTHEGTYGSGEKRIFNFAAMSENIKLIFKLNPELILLLLFIIVCLILTTIRFSEEKRKRNIFIFSGLLVIMLLQILIVIKHFSNYYLTPLFSLFGFTFFIFADFLSGNIKRKWVAWVMCSLLPLTFLISTTTKSTNSFAIIKKEKSEREKIAAFVKNEIDKKDYWFVEPTWESAPYIENGLVYGLSYCRHRDKYLTKLVNLNPNVITYEGEEEKPKRWRIAPLELDSVISTGNKIHIYSTPGRNATVLLKMLTNAANRCNIQLYTDTIYNDNISKRMIITVTGTNTNSN